jgi:hypothetical protein
LRRSANGFNERSTDGEAISFLTVEMRNML